MSYVKTSKAGYALYVRCGLDHGGHRLFAEHSATCWQCQGCGLAVSTESMVNAQKAGNSR